MAATRAFLTLAVLLLSCWLSFFGRDWQQGPALAAMAPAAIQTEPIRETLPAAPAVVLDSAARLALALEEALPAAISPEFTPTHVVGSPALHLRERPSARSPSLGSYPLGTLLMVYGREGNWVEVRLADGMQGWMSLRYVTVAPVATATADR